MSPLSVSQLEPALTETGTQLRIAHVTDGYLPRIGGIERQVHGLSQAQQSAGHAVSVFTVVGGTSADDGVAIYRPSSRGRETALGYVRAPALARLVAAGEFDVIHLHASIFSPLAYLAAAKVARSTPTLMTVHSLWCNAAPLIRASDALLRWSSWPLMWSAVSQAAADDVQAVLAGSSAIAVLPNGIDAGYWRCTPGLGHQESSAHAVTAVTIVAVMRLTQRKRGHALLRIIREMLVDLPVQMVRVRIIGDGPQRSAMAAEIRASGLADVVELVGALEPHQIRHELHEADIFVAPAPMESFGIAALEAQAAGVPVVAFSRSGVADVVEHEHTGLLVDSDGTMTAALLRLCRDTELRARLAGHASLRAAEFDWSVTATRVERCYRRMLAAAPA